MPEGKRSSRRSRRVLKVCAAWLGGPALAIAAVVAGPAAAHADDSPPSAAETLAAIETIAPDAVAGVDTDSGGDPQDGVALGAASDDGGTVVQIPTDAQDGISLTTPRNPAASITIGLPRAQGLTDADVAAAGVAVFTAADGVATVPVVHDQGWLGINTVIPDASSPTDYSYDIQAAAGASLSKNDDGSVSLLGGDGAVLGVIAPPWARDANGAALPTSFSVFGLTVTQHVDLSAGSIAFPVVADPEYVANSVDSARASLKKTDDGYTFSYWVATTKTTPSAVMDATQAHFGADFPPLQWQPKAKLTSVGQVLETRLGGLRQPNVFSGHVKVTKLSSTGWTFYAEQDHPDGGGTIAFNFSKNSKNDLDLGVVAHIPHGVAGGPLYYVLTYVLWADYAAQVQARMGFTKL